MGIISKVKISILKKKLLKEEKLQKKREEENLKRLKKANKALKEQKKIKQLEQELKKRIQSAKTGGYTRAELAIIKARKEEVLKRKKKLASAAKDIFKSTGKFVTSLGAGIDRAIIEAEKRKLIKRKLIKRKPLKIKLLKRRNERSYYS